MKKKLPVIICLMFTVFLTSCNKNKHKASSEWTHDDNQHWHACETKGHDDKFDVANHTWDGGLVTDEPTEEKEGVMTYTCVVCEATKTTPIERLPHTHTFDLDNWENDSAHHWHKATCGHDVKMDEAEHTFGNWSEKTPAGIDQAKEYSRKCSVCDYEDALEFEDTKTNGAYCVAIKQVIKMSDYKLLSVDVLRGTITTGDNFVFDGVDGEFSIDKITSNKMEVTSAKCGDSVDLQISADSGDLDQIDNRSVGGRLAYEPKTVKFYNTFNVMVTFVESTFSKKIYAGREVYIDLYNTGTMMIPYKVVLPEGITLAEDGVQYFVTVTLPNNANRPLWAGMEFSYKLYDSTTSSDVLVAKGIILSVNE